jgi:hypothetical protein
MWLATKGRITGRFDRQLPQAPGVGHWAQCRRPLEILRTEARLRQECRAVTARRLQRSSNGFDPGCQDITATYGRMRSQWCTPSGPIRHRQATQLNTRTEAERRVAWDGVAGQAIVARGELVRIALPLRSKEGKWPQRDISQGVAK